LSLFTVSFLLNFFWEYSEPVQSHHGVQTKVDPWTEEEPSYLIQEGVTAVHQYFAIHRSRNRLEPEKRLMLAVLQDALFCFHRYFRARYGRRRKLFCESWQWFNEEGRDSVFAFENICEVLRLDAFIYQARIKNRAKDCPPRSVDIDRLICA